jgi:PTH1 family peptidyl-tRNA hydrolase
MKFLIAGLGNIGSEYEHTRHNIGFDVLDLLAKKNEQSFAPDKLASVATIRHKGKTFVLIKPSTYMNLSGKAVNYWMQKEKIGAENLLVITDDLALPLGKLRMRGKGSDGGHNGLKNIQEVLGTQEYPRLRFGIGSEFGKGQQVNFVLGKWLAEEKEILEQTIERAANAVLSFGLVGLARTMNQFN